jgi:hypothetical protein
MSSEAKLHTTSGVRRRCNTGLLPLWVIASTRAKRANHRVTINIPLPPLTLLQVRLHGINHNALELPASAELRGARRRSCFRLQLPAAGTLSRDHNETRYQNTRRAQYEHLK